MICDLNSSQSTDQEMQYFSQQHANTFKVDGIQCQ